MSAGKPPSDSVMAIRQKLRQAARDSGLSQEEIGVRMGLAKPSARKAISRLLNVQHDYDPRLSTLLALADALEISLKDLL